MTVTFDELAQAVAQAPDQSGNTLLPDSWILGFDTETTGVAAGRDAIVSVSLVLRNPAIGYEDDVSGDWIINPHRHMNPAASRINGFTDKFLASKGEEPEDAVGQVAHLITIAQAKHIPLLAYNAPFDLSMLTADLHRWNLDPIEVHLVVDPLIIDRAISKRQGRRTLEFTTQYYGVEPHGDFHDAKADTTAAIDLIKPMSTLYPQVARLSLDAIMDWQRKAHQEWLQSFNSWLASKGRQPVRDTWL